MEALKLGKREQNRINNRHAILQAAKACFRELGYERTTIRDIIRRTDLAAGTFYNYFSDKRDIFSALLHDFLATLNRNIETLRQSARTETDFIRSTYLALFQATAEDPLIYELAHKNDQAIRELFGSDILGLAMASLDDDIRNAAKRGLFQHVNHEYLSAAFFGIAYEMSLQVARRVHHAPETRDSEAEQAADFVTSLFLRGISRFDA
ncbi:MAG: TetR family transcriptional regulator [Alteromonadaceae bacterium]|uniref:TetR/AcrR family transcriptional regulator n=1 Tax=unclassified Marinobacter TaxID=83889 RepID=UPI000C38AE89|nr:TetR/AcrR family transcriptional regulator [Marinobacter sp. BGYM27]MAA63285.1 TetR family transcriptional regulator [Alteromonadaceae bacterium]MBH85565.1 TetR family transcriptional regulator [Alteromonadaceae bacterium]MDG5500545.1 TetR/AcrR family transcriptional regulator [Marinobacter sp. BGYM27]|tara:strand:+ start:10128 stop:10751 length:624 start_codon:yes stop_codon:yes gene_type:complete